MHRSRATLALLSLTTALALRPALPLALAQAPAPPATLPAVRTELVQLDVVVTDANGRPVADLDAASFQVTEDGKPQTIGQFAVESRFAARPAPEAAAAPSPHAAAPAPTAPPVSVGRHFVLAVDDLHTAPGSMAAARDAMTRFVETQLADEDDVALVTTSGERGVFQDFTHNRAALARAIARVESRYQPVEPGGAPYLSEYQAVLIDRSDAEALRVAVQEILQTEDYLGEVGAREKAYAQARRMVFEIMARAGRTLGAVEGVVRGLAPLAGRKIVVLVSDGFLVGLGAAENRAFDVRKIVDAATRAGVVLYALDTRGLVADVPGGSASFQGPGVLTAPGGRSSLQARGVEAQREGLNALAEDTGGFLVRNTNDLGGGLARVVRDNETYYLLAYEPTNAARDGRFRKIQVRVSGRSGLKARTRSGYFAPDERKAAATTADPRARERELAQALSSLFPLEGVPLTMSADYIDLPPTGAQAVVRAHVDVAGVPFVPSADRYTADLEIAGAVYDEAGQLVGDVAGERAQLSLTEDSYRRALAEGLTVQKTVPLRPGRYQVRLAAREATRSLLGSAHQWLEIPDVLAQPLTLSSVFLLADAGDAVAGENLSDVQVERRFRRGQGLHYVVHVYERAGGSADVVLQAQIRQGQRLVGVTPSHPLPPAAAGRKWSERVSLAAFAPGVYELRVLATDKTTSRSIERRLSFRVE